MSPPILNDEDLKARIPVLAKYINEAEIVAQNESSSKFEVVKALNRLTNYLAPMEKYSQVGAASPEVIQWYITTIHPTMFAANEVKSDLQSILQMIREAENKLKDAENTVLVTPQPHNEQVLITFNRMIEKLKTEFLSEENQMFEKFKTEFLSEVKTVKEDVDIYKKALAHVYVGEAANALRSLLNALSRKQRSQLYGEANLTKVEVDNLKNELWNFKENRNTLSHIGEKLFENFSKEALGNALTTSKR